MKVLYVKFYLLFISRPVTTAEVGLYCFVNDYVGLSVVLQFCLSTVC